MAVDDDRLDAVLRSAMAPGARPLAVPRPTAWVRRAGDRIARRRRAGAGPAAAVALVGVAAVVARPGERDSLVVSSAADVVRGGYVAEAAGGYEGEGDWTLVVERADGSVVVRDAATGPACEPAGFVAPGDRVRAEVRGAGSRLAVGEDAGC